MFGSPAQHALRFFTGAGGLLMLYLGLRMAFPSEGGLFYLWSRFFRYGLLGVWITFGAPWLFCRLHLAEKQTAQAPG